MKIESVPSGVGANVDKKDSGGTKQHVSGAVRLYICIELAVNSNVCTHIQCSIMLSSIETLLPKVMGHNVIRGGPQKYILVRIPFN